MKTGSKLHKTPRREKEKTVRVKAVDRTIILLTQAIELLKEKKDYKAFNTYVDYRGITQGAGRTWGIRAKKAIKDFERLMGL